MLTEKGVIENLAGQSIAGVVFDLDGTILRGDLLLPAAAETIKSLRNRQIKVCFLTNDNRSPISSWLEKLHKNQIDASPEEVLTSAVIAAETVADLYPNGTILIADNSGLNDAFSSFEFERLDWESEKQADVVIIGKDPLFDQERLRIACNHIWKGAELVATNIDRKMPVENGFIPGTGAMVQAIAYATSTNPMVTGKPSQYAADIVQKRLGVPAKQIVMVGDSLTSDIKLGKTAKMRTVLTLTGTHDRQAALALPASDQPDFIIEDLSALIPTLFGEAE